MTELCINCKVRYKTIKQGVTVEETAVFGSYKLWEADLKECPKCGHQIVAGFAKENFAEHYQEGYKEKLEQIKKEGMTFQWNEK